MRFINDLARYTEMTVELVNDGLPLEHNKIYEVSNDLADKLLHNEGDWRLLAPPEPETKIDETPIIKAEKAGKND